MKRIYDSLFRKKAGFSLVEIMVVISVMSVLSGVAVPSYVTIKNRSSESGTESDMRSIATALEMYNNHNDIYPSSEEGIEKLKNEGYIKNAPENDLWDNQYSYSSDGDSYNYQSSGVDGESGTDDDIIFQNGTMIADGGYGDPSGGGDDEPAVVVAVKDPVVSDKPSKEKAKKSKDDKFSLIDKEIKKYYKSKK